MTAFWSAILGLSAFAFLLCAVGYWGLGIALIVLLLVACFGLSLCRVAARSSDFNEHVESAFSMLDEPSPHPLYDAVAARMAAGIDDEWAAMNGGAR